MIERSIEYAHIYVDQSWDESFSKMVSDTKKITESWDKDSYSLNILIDDYNPTTWSLDVDDFINKLEEKGLEPDFILFESELVKIKDDVMSLITDSKVKRNYEKYIEQKGHVPCSFLIVCWYCLRRGIISNGELNFYRFNSKKDFIGKELVNILQSKYTEPEQKADEILKNSAISEVLDSIKRIYLEG